MSPRRCTRDRPTWSCKAQARHTMTRNSVSNNKGVPVRVWHVGGPCKQGLTHGTCNFAGHPAAIHSSCSLYCVTHTAQRQKHLPLHSLKVAMESVRQSKQPTHAQLHGRTACALLACSQRQHSCLRTAGAKVCCIVTLPGQHAGTHLQILGLQQLLAQAPGLVDVTCLQDAALDQQDVLEVWQGAVQKVGQHLQQLVSGGPCSTTQVNMCSISQQW